MMHSPFFEALAGLGWPAYLAILVAMFVEGELVLFTTVYLAGSGILNLWILIPTLFMGTVLGDTFWYFLGEYLDMRHLWVRKWFGKATGPINRRLAARPGIVIFVSKFTYGLNKITLLRSRTNGVGFRRFIAIELFTVICWMSVIGNLAWFASAISSEYFKKYIEYSEIGLLFGIVLMTLFVHLIKRIAHRALNGGRQKIALAKENL
jgi:membrane protein DedA with SNARE-associated domain